MNVTYNDAGDEGVSSTANGGDTAGYAYNGAAYCVECAADVEVTIDGETVAMPDAADVDGHDSNGFGVGEIRTSSEWDAPGATCDVCHDRLPTRVIHYGDDDVGGGA